MIDAEKKQFQQMMFLLHEVYRKAEPSKELLGLWWGKLVKFDLDVVSFAFNHWSDHESIMATPANILELCKAEADKRELHRVTIAPRTNSLLTYQNNKTHAAELKQKVETLMGNSERKDHRRWAKKIVKRLEEGDRSVPEIAVKFAGEALHVEMA